MNGRTYKILFQLLLGVMLAGMPVIVGTATCYFQAIESMAEDNREAVEENRRELVRREAVIEQVPAIRREVRRVRETQIEQNTLLRAIARKVGVLEEGERQ